MSAMNRSVLCGVLVSLCAVIFGACGAAAPMKKVQMAPMNIPQNPQPQVLDKNHFRSDRMGNLSEEQLREILDAPVFLEDRARVGIVPVATAYEVDQDLPLATVPQRLSESLESTGHFDVITEVSTDWPANGSVAGLRELAARYRVRYLLLYRHRFEHRDYTNPWGWAWLTGVGGLMTPNQTLEAAGVMEASLFDVRTGTILFTVFERVGGEENVSVWYNDAKRRSLKQDLLDEGTALLGKQVVHKVQMLVSARDIYEEDLKKAQPTAAPASATVQPATAP